MRNKPILIGLSVIVALAVVAAVVSAGNPSNPPGPPNTTSSYTLEDIYDRLDIGAAGSKSTFKEPASGPATGTGHTLNQIMAIAPAVDDTNGAIAAQVASGATFWGLQSGTWGPQTGRLYGGCTCAHRTPVGTRWCDNGDGTVTDLLGYNGVGQCLVWLKDADCDADLAGINKTDMLDWYDAMTWSSAVKDGACGLSDGSNKYVWRLATRAELEGITKGTHPVSSSNMQSFTNVNGNWYWSSTSWTAGAGSHAEAVKMDDGSLFQIPKSHVFRVWPVRGGP